jgi:hypothetical protein
MNPPAVKPWKNTISTNQMEAFHKEGIARKETQNANADPPLQYEFN